MSSINNHNCDWWFLFFLLLVVLPHFVYLFNSSFLAFLGLQSSHLITKKGMRLHHQRRWVRNISSLICSYASISPEIFVLLLTLTERDCNHRNGLCMNDFFGTYFCKIGALHCISKDLSYNCRQILRVLSNLWLLCRVTRLGKCWALWKDIVLFI